MVLSSPALPGLSITDEGARGPNQLIRDGATPVLDANDGQYSMPTTYSTDLVADPGCGLPHRGSCL